MFRRLLLKDEKGKGIVSYSIMVTVLYLNNEREARHTRVDGVEIEALFFLSIERHELNKKKLQYVSYLQFETKVGGGCLRDAELVLLKSVDSPPLLFSTSSARFWCVATRRFLPGHSFRKEFWPDDDGCRGHCLVEEPPVVPFSNPTRTRSVTLATLVSSATNAAYILPLLSTREARPSRKLAVASTPSFASVYLISNYNVGKREE